MKMPATGASAQAMRTPMGTKQEELRSLIEFLREQGVLEYENEGIKITLLPQKPQELPAIPKRIFKPGRDALMGLTEEDQFDLFNDILSPVVE